MIFVPTGLLTAKTGVEKTVLHTFIDKKLVARVIYMPSNVFTNTGPNVSVLFFDKSGNRKNVTLIDASKLGELYKEGSIQKRRLRAEEINQIVDIFNKQKSVDDFSVNVTYDEIKEKNYSLAAGQYFDVKIEYVDFTPLKNSKPK